MPYPTLAIFRGRDIKGVHYYGLLKRVQTWAARGYNMEDMLFLGCVCPKLYNNVWKPSLSAISNVHPKKSTKNS